ncbi:hypothetical protein NUACC21_24640 [Scytonema sp. NUACC21]
MAELTQEDREIYEKLKVAFATLNYPSTPIGQITTSVKNELQKTLNNDTGELRRRVDLVNGYLKIQALLSPDKSADVREIVNLNNQLDRSLKVVEDEIVDLTNEIEIISSDSLLLQFLRRLSCSQNLINWTEALLSDRDPNLTEEQTKQLIQSWGQAVHKFVDDARKKDESCDRVTPGEPETFANFFGIHNELETLYSRLADTDTVQRAR